MTRKHEALAAALHDAKPVQECYEPLINQAQYREALAQWRIDVRAIASVLLAHNPRFNTRFYAACGYVTAEPV